MILRPHGTYCISLRCFADEDMEEDADDEEDEEDILAEARAQRQQSHFQVRLLNQESLCPHCVLLHPTYICRFP